MAEPTTTPTPAPFDPNAFINEALGGPKVKTRYSGLSEADLRKAYIEGRISEADYRAELKARDYGEGAIEETVAGSRAQPTATRSAIKPPSLPGAGYGDQTQPIEQVIAEQGPEAAFRIQVEQNGLSPAMAAASIQKLMSASSAPKPSPLSAGLTYDAQGKPYQYNSQTGQYVPAPPQFTKPRPVAPPQPGVTPGWQPGGDIYANQVPYATATNGGVQPMQQIAFEDATPEQLAAYYRAIGTPGYAEGTGKGGLVLNEPARIVGMSGRVYGVIGEPTRDEPQGQKERLKIEPMHEEQTSAYHPQTEDIMLGREMQGGLKMFADGGTIYNPYANVQQGLTPQQIAQNDANAAAKRAAAGLAPTVATAPSGGGTSSDAYAQQMRQYQQQLSQYNAQMAYYRQQQAEFAQQQAEMQALNAAAADQGNLAATATARRNQQNLDYRWGEGGLNTPQDMLRPLSGDESRAPEGSRWAIETLAEYLKRQQEQLQALRGLDLQKQAVGVNLKSPKPLKPLAPSGGLSGGGGGSVFSG